MGVSKSLLAYTDCIDYFDTALRFSEGCRIPVPDRDFAIRLRMRLNYCRSLDRENNMRLYPEGHMMHGRSQYDKITNTISEVEGKVYLMLERNDLQRMPIEPLGQELQVLEPAEPQLQLAAPAPNEMEDLEVADGNEAEPVEAEIKTADGWRRL